jgi:hypothetical protein
MIGQDVRKEQSVDDHIGVLLGKWPMADRHIENCVGRLKS